MKVIKYGVVKLHYKAIPCSGAVARPLRAGELGGGAAQGAEGAPQGPRGPQGDQPRGGLLLRILRQREAGQDLAGGDDQGGGGGRRVRVRHRHRRVRG